MNSLKHLPPSTDAAPAESSELEKRLPPSTDGAPAESNEKDVKKSSKSRRSRSLLGILAVGVVVIAAMLLLYDRDTAMGTARPGFEASFVMPLDEIVSDMVAGFDDFSFVLANGEKELKVGKFRAKRVSAVNGRVRINFDAVAFDSGSSEQWDVSTLVECILVGRGSRLEAIDIVVPRIHVYNLPKEFGSDHLEYNDDIVTKIKARILPSKEIVYGNEEISDVEVTVDDNVKVVIGGKNE